MAKMDDDKYFALDSDEGPLGPDIRWTRPTGTGLGPRLKNGVNVSELLEKGAFTFELDGVGDDESLDIDDEDDYDKKDHEHDHGEEVELLREFTGTHSNSKDRKHETICQSIDVEEATGEFSGLLEKMENVTEDGKVKKLVIKKGSGKPIPQDGKVWFDYIAFAEGKDEAFDSTLKRDFPEGVTFNKGGCLPGLEIGLKSMHYDEVAKFWIHYDLAYGKYGAPPRIPAESSIVFTVELKQVVTAEEMKSCLFMSRDERNRLPFAEVFKFANDMKVAGNGYYQNGKDYREAIKRYRKALDLLESYATVKSSEDRQRNELVFGLYTNLAQCYLKESLPAKACQACKAALQLPAQDSGLAYKIYYRFAQAKVKLQDLEEAHKLVKKALEKMPHKVKEIEDFEVQIKKAIDAQSKGMESMCRKMFSNNI